MRIAVHPAVVAGHGIARALVTVGARADALARVAPLSGLEAVVEDVWIGARSATVVQMMARREERGCACTRSRLYSGHTDSGAGETERAER